MSDSIWKKEISLGRKRAKAHEPVADASVDEEAPKQSVWKKEISFGRKHKTAEAAETPESLRMKELAFQRRLERAAQTAGPVPDAPPVAEQAVAASGDEEAPKQSVWKKEISFGRKQKSEAPAQAAVPEPVQQPIVEAAFLPVPAPMPAVPAPVAPPVAEQAVAASGAEEAPKQSIWKKEISFGRKQTTEETADTPESLRVKELAFQHGLVEAAQTAVPEPAPQPAVEEAFVPVLAPAAPTTPAEPESIWKKEITFRKKPAEPVAPAGAPGEPSPEEPVSIWKKEITFRRKHDADSQAQDRGDSIWTREISFRRRQQWDKEIEKITQEALREVDEAEAAADQWLAEPELPPEPLAEADDPAPKVAARKAAPPKVAAPAAAAPTEDRPAAKKSIWKREIGKPKAKAAPAASEPKAKKEPKQKRRLRDVQITMPKPAAKSRAGGSHPVKRLVGLKVGASQLAAARVVNNGAAELVQVARQPIDSGVVVGGEVRDPEALSLALKQFFAKNKLPKKNVRLGIASNRIGVRIFDLVGIADDKQLENAIRFRAQETLPIPLDEAVLDYHVLGETTDEEGATVQRVLLVVAYRELVERYVSACKKAGITLSGVDLEAFALLRSLAAPPAEDSRGDSALVAVAIGHDRSTFAVSDGHICEFTRVIEWGGATLSVAIARAVDLAPSEVEQLKRLVSLESPAVPDGVAPEQYALAVEAVRRQVQAFARELVSSLQFYQHQPGSLGIGEIVITGGTAGLVGLAAELQGLIGVRVRVGDPLSRLKVSKKVAVDDGLGSYAIAIGLGIED